METTAAARLPAVLALYHHQFPNVDLALKTGPTESLIHSVLNYELDGAFVAGPVEHPELSQSAVIEEELVIIADPLQPVEYLYETSVLREFISIIKKEII